MWRLASSFSASSPLIHPFGRPPGRYDFWDYSTNAVATVRLGIPTIGFGPGDGKQAHMRDEKCDVRQIIDACTFYTHAIDRL